MNADQIKPGMRVAINTDLTGEASALVVSVHPQMKAVTVLWSDDDGETEEEIIIRMGEVKYRLPSIHQLRP